MEGSATESDRVREDLHNNFEKAKAHGSTLEASISEVSDKLVGSCCCSFSFNKST